MMYHFFWYTCCWTSTLIRPKLDNKDPERHLATQGGHLYCINVDNNSVEFPGEYRITKSFG